MEHIKGEVRSLWIEVPEISKRINKNFIVEDQVKDIWVNEGPDGTGNIVVYQIVLIFTQLCSDPSSEEEV